MKNENTPSHITLFDIQNSIQLYAILSFDLLVDIICDFVRLGLEFGRVSSKFIQRSFGNV